MTIPGNGAGKGHHWREDTNFGRYHKGLNLLKFNKQEPKAKEKRNLKNGKVRYIY